MIADIYPIYLTSSVAHMLCMKHASKELQDSTRFHSTQASYEYTARVLKTGEVELSVFYTDDTSFIMSSGTCMRKTIKPFDKKQLEEIEEREMLRLATEVWNRRQTKKMLEEIELIKNEMFS